MASRRNGTLYVGVTSNLSNRISIHKLDVVEGFTKKYQVHELVYFEELGTMLEAIAREKQLKNWKRKWITDQVGNDGLPRMNFICGVR